MDKTWNLNKRDIRLATRRQYSAEEKIRIVLEGVKTAESDREVNDRFVELHLKLGIASLKQLVNKGDTVKHLKF